MEQEIILKSIFEAFVLCSYVATGFCHSSLYFFSLKTVSQLLTEPRGKSGVVLPLRKTNSRRFASSGQVELLMNYLIKRRVLFLLHRFMQLVS